MTLPALVNSVLNTIGHTPVVRLRRLAPPGGADVFVKLEYFNPTGSYKDRMALAMIEGAENARRARARACAWSSSPAAAPARRWRWSAR